jgi:hypothetical protein
MTDDVLRHVLVWGSVSEVGTRLARLVADLRPDSIGISLLQTDIPKALDTSAAAFASMRRELGSLPKRLFGGNPPTCTRR